TFSTNNIATTGVHQTTFGGGEGNGDTFIAKFNTNGVRLWGTYYGGNQGEFGSAIAVDGSGNVYVCGNTSSSNAIATAGAHQTTFGGDIDAFIVKFTTNGVRLWGTYYGSFGWDQGIGIAVDGGGNVYITGETSSFNAIATAGAHQTTYGGGFRDAFIAKFST
ncbi:MAG TPA: SBBP repeat-containing protein, partial [Candidatus Kapabacteria bacterium]|nr:SBBP repeat-containing protein [Candidatus Kapabacteria bacterium]